ncbi:mitochondrial import inner membrane translocase subunit Tim10 [Onthophagus taurus]|uniref:mitochondrial import inner membrane translocase subunit Tim10 n=1 Tax=Onthophagus taurus TaxID=166361 RepID=UPI0039BE8B05
MDDKECNKSDGESSQKPAKILHELEMEMMSDMYSRVACLCHRKCVPPDYFDGELGKGQAVCLDRCVAKFLDVHQVFGKKLAEMSAKQIN